MLIVGEKEVTDQKVAVRKHGKGDQGSVGLNEFVESFRKECATPA